MSMKELRRWFRNAEGRDGFAQFVPDRLLWNNWLRFISEVRDETLQREQGSERREVSQKHSSD